MKKVNQTRKKNKSDNVGNCKVRRMIDLWGAIEKSPILIFQNLEINNLIVHVNYFAFLVHQLLFSPTVESV